MPTTSGAESTGKVCRRTARITQRHRFTVVFAEEAETRSIVDRIAHIKRHVARRVDIDAVTFGEYTTGHCELVIAAKPAEDPQIVVRRIGAGCTQRRRDGHVNIDLVGTGERDAGQPEGLVVGESGRRHGFAHLTGDFFEPGRYGPPADLAMPEGADKTMAFGSLEEEAAILTDHAIHIRAI